MIDSHDLAVLVVAIFVFITVLIGILLFLWLR